MLLYKVPDGRLGLRGLWGKRIWKLLKTDTQKYNEIRPVAVADVLQTERGYCRATWFGVSYKPFAVLVNGS